MLRLRPPTSPHSLAKAFTRAQLLATRLVPPTFPLPWDSLSPPPAGLYFSSSCTTLPLAVRLCDDLLLLSVSSKHSPSVVVNTGLTIGALPVWLAPGPTLSQQLRPQAS